MRGKQEFSSIWKWIFFPHHSHVICRMDNSCHLHLEPTSFHQKEFDKKENLSGSNFFPTQFDIKSSIEVLTDDVT